MKIAILTNFSEMYDGYSLTTVVRDQIYTLLRYGHEVHLYVSELYHDADFGGGVVIHKAVPDAALVDYRNRAEYTPEYLNAVKEAASGKEDTGISERWAVDGRPLAEIAKAMEAMWDIQKRTEALILKEFSAYDAVLTHDMVFQGWQFPYLAAIEAVAAKTSARWLHWVHSIPTGVCDRWDARKLDNRHKLIYPNATDALRVAEAFRVRRDKVRVIPHVCDPRTFMRFLPDTVDLIDAYPSLMSADIVQIMPASVDRLPAKRISETIQIFGNFKSMGKSVCLFIATQWATGDEQRRILDAYKQHAANCGLVLNQDVIFSADYADIVSDPGKQCLFKVGIPRGVLRDLFTLSNMFIFFTREETYSLVLPEAALAGTPLIVINQSLDMLREVTGGISPAWDMGSFNRTHNHENKDQYLYNISLRILDRFLANEAVLQKTWYRQRGNMDAVYCNNYAPAFASVGCTF